MVDWVTVYIIVNIYYLVYSLSIVIIVLTLIGYITLIMGWASNSIYSIIGGQYVLLLTLMKLDLFQLF